MKKLLAHILAVTTLCVAVSALHPKRAEAFQSFIVNGSTFPFPDVDDEEWGQYVTDWAQAVTAAISTTNVAAATSALTIATTTLKLTANNTNYIQSRTSLQAGTTFFVSSGTVAGPLVVGSTLTVNGAIVSTSSFVLAGGTLTAGIRMPDGTLLITAVSAVSGTGYYGSTVTKEIFIPGEIYYATATINATPGVFHTGRATFTITSWQAFAAFGSTVGASQFALAYSSFTGPNNSWSYLDNVIMDTGSAYSVWKASSMPIWANSKLYVHISTCATSGLLPSDFGVKLHGFWNGPPSGTP